MRWPCLLYTSDTLVICSTTAITLLVSGVEGQVGVMDGIPFVQAAVKTGMGEWGIHFITVAIFFFAFSSLVGNYYYAESNIRFIRDSKVLLNVFRCTCLVAIFLGAQDVYKRQCLNEWFAVFPCRKDVLAKQALTILAVCSAAASMLTVELYNRTRA